MRHISRSRKARIRAQNGCCLGRRLARVFRFFLAVKAASQQMPPRYQIRRLMGLQLRSRAENAGKPPLAALAGFFERLSCNSYGEAIRPSHDAARGSGQVLFTPAEMFVLMEAPKGWPRA